MKRFDRDKALLVEATRAIRQHGNIHAAFRATPADRTDLRACLEYMSRVSRNPQPKSSTTAKQEGMKGTRP